MTIQQTTLGISSTEVVPAPVSGSYAAVGVFFCNYTSNPVTIQIYVTNTGSGVDAKSIFRDLVLSPKETFTLNMEKILLSTGWSVVAIADAANAVVATASYIAI